MLKLKNIVKNYVVGDNVVEALRGVDLEFRKSEFVAILGPSGCGKTTLLNIVGGLDRYTIGDLIINGKSTRHFTDYDWDSYRNHTIGFVFQTYNLIHHQSVLGNVELALTLSGISKSERKRRAIEALVSVGLHDKIYKKPNQLSGGQMQRVAIARALVNNPDVILADEPTGAIDSETSIQIMEILKKISQDRLVVMVTHNPDLANRYSTRIIRLLDGKVTGDSNPYHTEDVPQIKQKQKRKKVARSDRTSMSFLTAFGLSIRNLLTKKGRTILTAFAGSIGIIGIGLVLSVSNGFQNYIDKMQTDTLSNFPLTISSETIDFETLMNFRHKTDLEEFPATDRIYINKIMELLESGSIKNDLNDEYIDNVIKNGLDKSLYNSITYHYGISMNIFKEVKTEISTIYQKLPASQWSQLPVSDKSSDQYSFLKSQYDVIAGDLPKNKNEIVLAVNTYNQISDRDLFSLGILYEKDQESFSFDDIIGTTYKILLNDAIYQLNETGTFFISNIKSMGNIKYVSEELGKTISDDVLELKIVGIVRPNETTDMGSIQGAIGYQAELTEYMFERAQNSEIIKWMNKEENQNLDPTNGDPYIDISHRNNQLREFGGIKKPVEIDIYPVSFDAKEKIKAYLDAYNENKKQEAIEKYYQDNGINPDNATAEEQKAAEKVGKAAGVYYTDMMGILVSSMSTLVNAISIVLIVFTSISLVVSSIMIGIITYISVLERTKEIGILRSIGARKKDISRVFNAEAIMIGFFAGIMGITISLLLLIPINIIVADLVDIENLASIHPLHIVALVIISMFLTYISGLIPSSVAAKRDPVIALRTE